MLIASNSLLMMPFLLIALLLQCAAPQIPVKVATSKSRIAISAVTEWEPRNNLIEANAWGFASHLVSAPE
jgi:hypothetical protein